MKPRIKVLLPKFEALKGISWAKELLLSFIGTTLSIVLTFGTAHFVEQKHIDNLLLVRLLHRSGGVHLPITWYMGVEG